jgi:hypothetical protein
MTSQPCGAGRMEAATPSLELPPPATAVPAATTTMAFLARHYRRLMHGIRFLMALRVPATGVRAFAAVAAAQGRAPRSRWRTACLATSCRPSVAGASRRVTRWARRGARAKPGLIPRWHGLCTCVTRVRRQRTPAHAGAAEFICRHTVAAAGALVIHDFCTATGASHAVSRPAAAAGAGSATGRGGGQPSFNTRAQAARALSASVSAGAFLGLDDNELEAVPGGATVLYAYYVLDGTPNRMAGYLVPGKDVEAWTSAWRRVALPAGAAAAVPTPASAQECASAAGSSACGSCMCSGDAWPSGAVSCCACAQSFHVACLAAVDPTVLRPTRSDGEGGNHEWTVQGLTGQQRFLCWYCHATLTDQVNEPVSDRATPAKMRALARTDSRPYTSGGSGADEDVDM